MKIIDIKGTLINLERISVIQFLSDAILISFDNRVFDIAVDLDKNRKDGSRYDCYVTKEELDNIEENLREKLEESLGEKLLKYAS